MPRRFVTLLVITLAWHLVNEHVTHLIPDANSQDYGQVIYRDYKRETPPGTAQVIITEGDGTGSLYVPEKVNESKGLIPSDSSYEVIDVAGKKAVLESQSFMPLVLAINADDNITLTIESSSLNRDEIIKFAEEILSSWSVTK